MSLSISSLHTALSGAFLQRSLLVAAVVGTVLNLINQGDAIFGAASLNWAKLAMTYIVPFCVSTYGAASALEIR